MKLTFKKFRTPEYNGNICENLNDRENVYILSEFCDEGDIFGNKLLLCFSAFYQNNINYDILLLFILENEEKSIEIINLFFS